MGKIDDERQEKMQAGRGRTAAAMNHTEMATDRRQPGQIAARSLSIQNFCRECNGFDSGGAGSMAAAVKECSATACWLWPWRNGKKYEHDEYGRGPKERD